MAKVSADIFTKAQAYAGRVVEGLSGAVSPFHSVETVKALLKSGGFEEVPEAEKWKLSSGGKYFTIRNHTSIAAFIVGQGCAETHPDHFKVIGCHTDSPCLRLAPITKTAAAGFEQVAIQTYGGGLWHTWFDRSLSLAGRVIIKNPETQALEEKHYKHDEPLL